MTYEITYRVISARLGDLPIPLVCMSMPVLKKMYYDIFCPSTAINRNIGIMAQPYLLI